MKKNNILFVGLFILTALCSETAFGGKNRKKKAQQQQRQAEQARRNASRADREQRHRERQAIQRQRADEDAEIERLLSFISDEGATTQTSQPDEESLCTKFAAACLGLCPRSSRYNFVDGPDSDDDDASFTESDDGAEAASDIRALLPLYTEYVARENAIDVVHRALDQSRHLLGTGNEMAGKPQAPVIQHQTGAAPNLMRTTLPPTPSLSMRRGTPSVAMQQFLEEEITDDDVTVAVCEDEENGEGSEPRSSSSSCSVSSTLIQEFTGLAPIPVAKMLLPLMTQQQAARTYGKKSSETVSGIHPLTGRRTKYIKDTRIVQSVPACVILRNQSQLFFEIFRLRNDAEIFTILRHLFTFAQECENSHIACTGIIITLRDLLKEHEEYALKTLTFFSHPDHREILTKLLEEPNAPLFLLSDREKKETCKWHTAILLFVAIVHQDKNKQEKVRTLLSKFPKAAAKFDNELSCR